MSSYPFEKQKLLGHIGNEELRKLFMNTGCIIAGGAITSIFSGKDINDVDVYFKDYNSLMIVLKNLFNNDDLEDADFYDLSSHSLIFTNMTKKSILFMKDGLNVQLIYFKFFKDAQEIFDTFDFTINMGAYDCAKGDFVLHPNFLKDVAQRQLMVNTNTAFPIISLLRVDKYIKRGYKISRKDFVGLCLAVNKLNITSWEEAADAIGGMYGYTYTDLFNTKEPFSIDEVIKQLMKLEVNIEEYKSESCNNDFYDIIDRINVNLKLEPKPEERMFYKKVVKTSTNGIYTSYYHKTFEYKLGQPVDGGSAGIWVYKSVRKARNHFVSSDKTKETILAIRASNDAQIIKDSGCFRIIGKADVIGEIEIDPNLIQEPQF